MEELVKLAVNGTGAAIVAFGAFFTIKDLIKQHTIQMSGRDQLFTKTVNEYLKDSNKVKQELAIKLQQFSDAAREQRESNKELKTSNHELRDAIEKMYEVMVIRNRQAKDSARQKITVTSGPIS